MGKIWLRYKQLVYTVSILIPISGCFHDSFYGGDGGDGGRYIYSDDATTLNYLKINDVDVAVGLSSDSNKSEFERILLSDAVVFAGDNTLPDINIGLLPSQSRGSIGSVNVSINNALEDSSIQLFINGLNIGGNESLSTVIMSVNIEYRRNSKDIASIRYDGSSESGGETDLSKLVTVLDGEVVIRTSAIMDALLPAIEAYVLKAASTSPLREEDIKSVSELKSFFSTGGLYVVELGSDYLLSYQNNLALRSMVCFFLADAETEKPTNAGDSCREEIAYVSSKTDFSEGLPKKGAVSAFTVNDVELSDSSERKIDGTVKPVYLGSNRQPDIKIKLENLEENGFGYFSLSYSLFNGSTSEHIEFKVSDIIVTPDSSKLNHHTTLSASYSRPDADNAMVYQLPDIVSVNIRHETSSVFELIDNELIIHTDAMLDSLAKQAEWNLVVFPDITPTVPVEFEVDSLYTLSLRLHETYRDIAVIGHCAFFGATEANVPEDTNAQCLLN